VRRNQEAEAWLDNHLEREGNNLIWYPSIKERYKYKELGGKYKDLPCYFIGKGPSLDNLKREFFSASDVPIFCINDSIHKIESFDLPNPVYMMQLDQARESQCQPKRAAVILPQELQSYYLDLEHRYIVKKKDFGICCNGAPTIVFAIALAQYMGIFDYIFIAFDAMQGGLGHNATCTKTTYRGDQTATYIRQFGQVKRQIVDANAVFVMPTEKGYERWTYQKQ